MIILLRRTSVISLNPTPKMPETILETTTPLSTILMAPASPLKTKKHGRELTNAEGVEIRQFFNDESHTKPSQKEVI
jgi:hypothetical protein